MKKNHNKKISKKKIIDKKISSTKVMSRNNKRKRSSNGKSGEPKNPRGVCFARTHTFHDARFGVVMESLLGFSGNSFYPGQKENRIGQMVSLSEGESNLQLSGANQFGYETNDGKESTLRTLAEEIGKFTQGSYSTVFFCVGWGQKEEIVLPKDAAIFTYSFDVSKWNYQIASEKAHGENKGDLFIVKGNSASTAVRVTCENLNNIVMIFYP